MDMESLEYGDRVKLKNEDICVYVRRELEVSDILENYGVIVQELVLINVFTGEEHSLNNYEYDLTNALDPQLDIIKFVN